MAVPNIIEVVAYAFKSLLLHFAVVNFFEYFVLVPKIVDVAALRHQNNDCGDVGKREVVNQAANEDVDTHQNLFL